MPEVDGFQVRVYGVHLRFHSTLPEAVCALRAAVVLPGWQAGCLEDQCGTLFSIERGENSAYRAYRDGIFLFGDERLGPVVKSLAAAAHHWLATHSNHIFIHAGSVAYKGKVLLLPGRSFVGKSTLTLALVERGAEYFSDEYAIVNALTGVVEPFPRPCELRDRSPLTLVTGSGPIPQPLGWVISLKYLPGAGWRVSAITAGEAVLVLFDNAVAAQRLGTKCLNVLARPAGLAQGWAGSRAEASQAAEHILDLLDSTI